MTDPPARGPCPDPNTLSAFSLGELPTASRDAVAAHVSLCPDCATASKPAPSAEVWLRDAFGGPSTVDLPPATASGPPADEPPPPPRIGQYESLRRIGRGGMGVVFRATHARLKKLVALKVLAPDRLLAPQIVARFRREMEVVGRLDHANIVW